jgi:hypothetical protein
MIEIWSGGDVGSHGGHEKHQNKGHKCNKRTPVLRDQLDLPWFLFDILAFHNGSKSITQLQQSSLK